MQKVLDFTKSYTFRNYFDMGIEADVLAQEFGYGFDRRSLNLPQFVGAIDWLADLELRVRRILSHVNLGNEQNRREALIAPLVADVVVYSNAQWRTEYSVKASDQLQGNLDFYLATSHQNQTQNVVIVEAKHADMVRGLAQLTAELIAIDRWTDSPQETIVGAITTGNFWQFARLDRSTQQVTQGLENYRVPEDIDAVVRILMQALV
jgi:hypothetical protein